MINQSKLRLHNKDLTRATEKLATGQRINQAKDDPFRNYEARNINSEISRIDKAKQNSTDGTSLLQIADGACNEVQSILQRIRELSIQSANDTLSSTERHYLDMEATELLREVDRISMGSIFNSKQIFGNKGDSFSEEERDLKDWKPFTAKNAAGVETRAGVLHIGYGADKPDEIKISIPEISRESLGLNTLSITYQAGATKAIDDLQSAINSIGTVRTYMGSIVSRLDIHVDDLQEKDINLNDYSGKIMDADIAKESTALASAQIKQQAAISILAQSNSRIGKVLEMLGGY
jgi:flagellin